MVREFSNHFDAVLFYEGQLEKLERQILVLLREREELQSQVKYNKRQLEQERILQR